MEIISSTAAETNYVLTEAQQETYDQERSNPEKAQPSYHFFTRLSNILNHQKWFMVPENQRLEQILELLKTRLKDAGYNIDKLENITPETISRLNDLVFNRSFGTNPITAELMDQMHDSALNIVNLVGHLYQDQNINYNTY